MALRTFVIAEVNLGLDSIFANVVHGLLVVARMKHNVGVSTHRVGVEDDGRQDART